MSEAVKTSRLSPPARALTVLAALALIAAAIVVPLRPSTGLAAVTEYSLGNTNGPNGLTLGPDGNIWVAETDGNGLAQVTPSGVITKYAANNPFSVVTGPDGALWYTDLQDGKIGRFNLTTHVSTLFPIPTLNSNPLGITKGADGNLWFVENKVDKVGRITTSGTVTEFSVLTTGSMSEAIAAGPDGNLWVAEHLANKIARVTTAGVGTEFTIPTPSSFPRGIAAGPDGNVWFTESLGEKVGSITPTGAITDFVVPNAISSPHPRGITAGIDGRIWFAEDDGATVYSLSTSGAFSGPYPIPTTGSTPFQMALGADGSAWFIENIPGKVAQVQTGPGAPAAAATPGNGSATVTWTAPPTGGSAITGYTVDAYQGTTLVSSTSAAANALSANILNLPNSAVLSFKVTATNAIGTGPPGVTNLVTIGMLEIAVPSAGGMFYMATGPDNRVWFAEAGANKLGASTAAGVVSEYPITTASSFPYGIATGGDGNVWFTELSANQIGRSSPTGTMVEFTVTTASSSPEGIAGGADGALWFVERGANKIGRISTAGTVTNEIAIPTAASYAEFITAGPDGAMWFTERAGNKIGRIQLTTPFTITEFTIPTASSGPQGIVLGPDGALWFTESFGSKIGRITTGGVFTEYPIPGAFALSRAITVGPDGAMWFTEDAGNAIGRITLAGAVSAYPVTTSGSSPTGIASFGGLIWFTENLADNIGHTDVGPFAGIASSTAQYRLANSDGVTWTELDSAKLRVTQMPIANQSTLVTANADLFTGTAGYNQDLGIFASDNGGVDQLLAWKESGGSAGTFSPNAAYVQDLYTMTAGHTYVFKLKWKTNRSAAGATIFAGAGSGPYSPTSLAAETFPTGVVPNFAVSTAQYHLANSNGVTWQSIDAAILSSTVSPSANATAVLGANADLWTANAGYNQDLGVFVSDNGGADSLVAWKESGGSAGTFSPNAAFVKATYPMTVGHSYVFTLKWKTNRGASGAMIFAGAGGGIFSPTSLLVQTIAVASGVSPYTAVSTSQHSLGNSDGATWQTMDPALNLTVAPGASRNSIIGANADLFTANLGYSQDIGIFVSDNGGADVLLAWKESGGFAGTFSPNAAFAQTTYDMTSGHSYVFKLKWKTNRNAPGSRIFAGAGSGPYSPTSLTVELAN